MQDETKFRHWVRGQGGVFTRAQALDHGLSPWAFRRGATVGEWVRYRGVFILADSTRDGKAPAWAALLRSGTDARVTGPTALGLRGLTIDAPEVFVSVPSTTHRCVEGVIYLRDANREDGVRSVDGVPSVSVQRAVIDSLRILDDDLGRDVLHEALRLGWVSSDYLESATAKLHGHKGLRQLRTHSQYAQGGTRAESERIVAGFLRQCGVGTWRANVSLRDRYGKQIGIGDFVDEKLRIVIEIDGVAWHSSEERFERDRSRQNKIANSGYLVLRFTWKDITQRRGDVIQDIRNAVEIQSSKRLAS